MTPTQQTTLKAFLIAVSQLETPISDELKQAIHQIGEELNRSEDKAIDMISEIVTQDPSLEKAYREARSILQEQYRSQERDKQDTLYSDSLTLTGMAVTILSADDFRSTSQNLLKQIQNTKDTFLKIWQVTLSISESRENLLVFSVLKALDENHLTIEDLVYKTSLPKAKVIQIVKRLWNEGKIYTLTGGFLGKFFPILIDKSKFNPDAYFVLTSVGYFDLHPVIKIG